MLSLDTIRVSRWVARMTEGDAAGAQTAIGWLRDDVLTCGVFYENFTGASITATIAVAPGAVMPREFLRAILAYPFRQLGARKILAFVADTNRRSKSLVERMGFVAEARVADYYPDGDMLVYALTEENCRYLEKEHGQED